MSKTIFMTIHPIVAEIFLSKPHANLMVELTTSLSRNNALVLWIIKGASHCQQL